uniref:Putative retrotransposon protein n=1 Tax=Phyllostachys edulis TaxID=38705 RepID=D3IVF0_PHYED|nr:putative retrotransposon protein [Phyllostachys edulis]
MAKLFAKRSKCVFGQPQVEYLGHIIKDNGVATDPVKVEAIRNWPEPQNITQLRSFLGLAGYYRRFIQGYGIICKPLFAALKKNGFVWESKQQEAFMHVKTTMSSAPVLTLPDYSQRFTLEADASGYGIGAVLMQGGRPISFMSKAIGPKAAALSTYDKEALAILEAIKMWKHYFAGSTLIIRTDQQSLKYMQEQIIIEGVQHKLLVKLLGYNYKVEYKRGRENKATDALSRVRYNDQVVAISAVTPVWILEVLASYEGDEKCRDLITQISISPTAQPNYSLKNGILRYKGRLYIGSNTGLKRQLLVTFHDSALGGHSGGRVTYQRLKLIFHWPRMKQEVEEFVKLYDVCQKNNCEHVPYPGLLQPIPIPEMAWTHISMDFIEGLPKSEDKEVILVVVDRFTKYSHFIALSHPFTVQHVVKVFVDNVFKHHGLPSVIITNRDMVFTSHLWQDLFKTLGVKLRLSTSYHPETDGQTKRVNQCLEGYLRCMVFANPKKWCSWLSTAEWWYDTSFHTSLKMTPFQALYGFPPPQIIEVVLPDFPSEEVKGILQRRQLAMQVIKDNLLRAQDGIKYYADKKRCEREFSVGDMVYLKI